MTGYWIPELRETLFLKTTSNFQFALRTSQENCEVERIPVPESFLEYFQFYFAVGKLGSKIGTFDNFSYVNNFHLNPPLFEIFEKGFYFFNHFNQNCAVYWSAHKRL
uniref:Uncharacterized protein n=1 Tax=Cacopsylla melanoneura TaxID=428564 RepID=A0A8D8SAX4_9HEMI